MKRWSVTIQHDVIVYAEDEDHAKNVVTAQERIHHNLQCITVSPLPRLEDEPQIPIIDERRAPGS